MPHCTILYWRDIPAQVVVKQGRKSAKKPLSERFEQAIDRAAMKCGAKDSDSYLAEWRRGDAVAVEGDIEDLLQSELTRLEETYTKEKLKQLIDNQGKEVAA